MSTTYKWTKNESDSELLGYPVAKIESASESHISELIQDLHNSGIRYATYRVPADDFHLIHTLEHAGFVMVDGFVEMTCDVSDAQDIKHTHIRVATHADLNQLTTLAGSVFQHTRYFNDPLIPVDRAHRRYSEWVENSLNGKMADVTVVWEEKGTILGLATVSYKDSEIPLVAVAAHTQGRGISRALVHEGCSILRARGITTAHIGTQIQNIAAMRSYQACGFKITHSYVTFRWSDLTA